MKSRIYAIALIIIAIITIISLVGWFLWKPLPVMLQGEIVCSSIKISSQMPGRVDTLAVHRGAAVRQGELLFSIGSKTVQAKLSQAEAMKNAASAQNTKVDKGARKQIIEQAYQMYQNSLVALNLITKSYDRVKNLYEAGVVSAQRFDEMAAHLTAAQNTSKAAKAQWDMAKDGAQWEDKQTAAALVAQAKGGVAEVESYLQDGAQYAPFDALVSSIIAEKGELVAAGYPVITLLDMSNVWVSFNIKETLLNKMKNGTKFQGYIPALDKSFPFEVTYIAPEASYATWSATRTSGEFDIKTFEVQARPMEHIAELRQGMSVTVDYDTL
ncbi:MAG: efflux RND transporter periplasmic adaptor subunit [Mucinivorans sp.]